MIKLPDCQYDYYPEAPKAKVVDMCEMCGCSIREGEVYYDIECMSICKDCIDDYRKVGEVE